MLGFLLPILWVPPEFLGDSCFVFSSYLTLLLGNLFQENRCWCLLATFPSFFRMIGRASVCESQVTTAFLPITWATRGLQSASCRVFHKHVPPSLCKIPGTAHQNVTAESKHVPSTPLLAPSRPCAASQGTGSRSNELSSCFFPLGIYWTFACLWSTVFKGCGWMNAKEDYAQALWEMIRSVFDFFFNKGISLPFS